MDIYENLISCLPKNKTSLIFAYGSGALPQDGVDQSKNMVDFIVAVDDAEEWHKINLHMNKRHYSFLRWFGAKEVAKIQKHYAAHIYYNTLVKVGRRMIKYGVIETKDLIADLIDWESLYVAGRLHKPIKVVFQDKNLELKEALALNLRSACHASLLLLPEQFSYEQFFTMLTSLSYDGDFRQYVAEDKFKISKIVKANMDAFTTLYEPILDAFDQTYVEHAKRRVVQDLSPTAVYNHLECLPKKVLHHVQMHCNRDGRRRDVEEVIISVAQNYEFPDDVRRAVSRVVFESSVKQTFKNAFTAGFRKSIIYGLTKVTKMIRSIR